MATQEMDVAKPARAERLAPKRVFMPRADIHETKDSIVILADMPGVDEKSVDITLEKNVLTIKGTVDAAGPQNYKPQYAEYSVGDYERVFAISGEIDRENISATTSNGVLKLVLPKSPAAQARKIAVKSE